MNKYVAIYNGKRIEVEAETSFAAQEKAAKQLRAKRSYQVIIALAEKDGKPVLHTAVD